MSLHFRRCRQPPFDTVCASIGDAPACGSQPASPPVAGNFMDIRYQLIFRGLKPGTSAAEARNNLCGMFDRSAPAICQAIPSPGSMIESGLTLSAAARLEIALDEAGLLCAAQEQIEAGGPDQPPAALAAQSTPGSAALNTWSDPPAQLRAVLQQNQLCLYCQPILTLDSGQFTMAEVFVRLRAEEKALLLPGDFLPVFEQYSMLPDLDRWVVCEVISHLGCGNSGFCYSINLSGPTLADAQFPDFVAGALTLARVPPAALLFEMDEADVLAQADAAERFSAAIKAIGCGVMIDSFARSALPYASLKSLKVDFVKVDGSTVRNVLKSADALARLNAVLRVGEVTGIGVIAECIEDQQVLDCVISLGAGWAQGYGIVKPYPIEQDGPAGAMRSTSVNVDIRGRVSYA